MYNLPSVVTHKFWILALSLLWLLYGGAAIASESEAASAKEGAPVGEESSAREWLDKLATALEKTSYRGVFVYARGADVNAMRIVHRYSDGTVTERLSQLDGANGEILRHDGEVVCILPNRGRLELNAIIPAGPFAGAFSQNLDPMSRWYRPHKLDDGRVAGFDTVVIAVTAKDRHRYSYRLWLERDTGLLLKSQVRNADGEVLERFQFTQLEITEDIADSELNVPVAGREVQKIHGSQSVQSRPATEQSPPGRSQDWRPDWTPDGFIPFTEINDQHYRLAAYSDGMASFSVFVEPMGAMDMPEGASRIGATTAYLHKVRFQDHVYLVTVVGEIPPETAMHVAESVNLSEKLAGFSGD